MAIMSMFGYTNIEKVRDKMDISNQIINKVLAENEGLTFEILNRQYVKYEKLKEKIVETGEIGKVFEVENGYKLYCVKKIFGKNNTEVWITDDSIQDEIDGYDFRFKFFFEVFDIIKDIEVFHKEVNNKEDMNLSTLIITNKDTKNPMRIYCKEQGVYIINLKYLHELMAGYSIMKVLEGIRNNQRDIVEDYVTTKNP